MSPRFRLAHEESPIRRAALTISFNFSSTPRTASMPHFGAFSFGFYNVSAIQVPLQRQQVATAAITVAIIVAMADRTE